MGAGSDYEYVGGWRRDAQHGRGVLVQKGVLKYTGELLSGCASPVKWIMVLIHSPDADSWTHLSTAECASYQKAC